LFKENTVFVVGAGASTEYGLPVGTKLANIIASLMKFEFDSGIYRKGDRLILNILRSHSKNSNEVLDKYIKAATRISEGIPHAESIDQFLYMHGDDEKAIFCGKTAIVRAILEAEQKSTLYYDLTKHPRTINFEKLNNHWLKPFFNQLINGIQKPDLKQIFRGITIICFNYDRCIEHYLIHALQKAYSISANEAVGLVALLEIYYPYGKVGKLKTELGQPGVAFGADLGPEEFIQAVQGIRTYTEQGEVEDSLAKIKRAIKNAKAIIFLGFAYHSQNMDILRPAEERGQVNAIFGTAVGISEYEQEEIKKIAQGLTRGDAKVEINQLNCSPFLEHFKMGLLKN
jgi:hypothetical protein